LAKGIRVNLLAKELGIESKLILQKLKDEGLGDKAPNHMSTLPLGLAESVREWFGGAGGGTAVETAPHVEVATKPKTVRSKKKKEPAAPAEAGAPAAEPALDSKVGIEAQHTVIVFDEAPPPAAATVAEPPPPAKKHPVRVRAPVAPARPAAEPTVEPPPPAPVAPPAPPAAGPAVAKPAAAAPPPAAPGSPGTTEHVRPPRPTVTLASRAASQLAPEVRKPVVQAPQLISLEPAKIQGPRVVRIEKQEAVEQRAPRPPRPAETTGVTPAGPRAGRGVKTADEDEEETKKKAAGKKGGSLSSRRRGVDGRRGEAMEKLKEFTDADLIARRDALNAAASSRNVFDTHLRQIERRGTHAIAKPITQRGEPVTVEEPITVRSLSAALGVKTNEVQSRR